MMDERHKGRNEGGKEGRRKVKIWKEIPRIFYTVSILF